MEPPHGRLRAVIRCFTHSWEEALPMIEKGHLIRFTGIVTYKTAEDLQRCATDAAPGSFMVDSDTPHPAPAPHRGKRREPPTRCK